MDVPHLSAVLNAQPFNGNLFPQQAAKSIAAALATAKELLATAELLFEHKRFAHCVSTSILAMEEAGKLPLILAGFLGLKDPEAMWKAYSRHHAKTKTANTAIAAQIRAHLPDIPSSVANALGGNSPTPETLEKTKQRAIYSDCLEFKRGCHVHQPNAINWEPVAWYVLCDARGIVEAPRAYSAAELSIWLKHAKICKKEHRGLATELAALEADLRKAGFIQGDWWKNILGPAP